MQVRPFENSDLNAVWLLLTDYGWGHRLPTASHLAQLVNASQRALVAVDGTGKLVGFARAITDELSNGYLSMVVVDAACRRQGVGRALVIAITESAPSVTWVLRAGRGGASAFFASLGFVSSAVAMERPRTHGLKEQQS